MADTNKQLLPHRGGVDKMTQGAGKNIVLASGELFIEYPNAGAGRGKCKIKIGDGVTAYSSLPYAIGDTSTDPITFTQGTEANIDRALAAISTGKPLNELIGNIKQLGNLIDVEIDALNNEDWYNSTDPTRAAHGIMLRADKTKLNGIQDGAEVNQNAFSTVSINSGSTTVNLQADSKTDKLTIKAGDNVALTPDAASDTVTINAKDSVYTAGSGIEISDANVIKQIKLNATTTSGNNNATTVQFGTSFKVPKIKFDTNGHMVSSEDVTLTIPTVGDSDEKVAQQAATDNADLRVLLSVTATDAGQIDVVKKQKDLTYNPNTKNLKVVKINGVDVGSSPKFTDNDTQYTAGVGMTLTGTVFKAKMKQDTASTLASNEVSTTAGRQYAVTPDKNGVLSVNVPWVDENTKYFAGGGINLNNGTFSNAGVRSVATGTAAGSIKVKTDDGDPVDIAVKDAALSVKTIARVGNTNQFVATRLNGSTFDFYQKDDNTTYTASDGIKLNGTNFTNDGVRNIYTDNNTPNGNISFNKAGTAYNVQVKGIGTAAYKADSYFATAGHTHTNATTAAAGFMSTAHVTKLNGIKEGAEVNPNTFTKISVENQECDLSSKNSELTLRGGSNVSLSYNFTDRSNPQVTIAAVDTKYTAGTCISISNTNEISAIGVITNVTDDDPNIGNGQFCVSGRNLNGIGFTKMVSVKGLGTAAYRADSAFAASNHNHDSVYLKLSGGTLSGNLYMANNKDIIFNGSGYIYSNSSTGNVYFGTNDRPISGIYSNEYRSSSNIDLIAASTGGAIRCYKGSANAANFNDIYCKNIYCKSGAVYCTSIKGDSVTTIPVAAHLDLKDGATRYNLTCNYVHAYGTVDAKNNLTVAGYITATGYITTNGNITAGNGLESANIKCYGSLISVNATIEGSSGNTDFIFKNGSTKGNYCFCKINANRASLSAGDYQDLYCNDVWYYGALHPASGGSSREYKENIKPMSDELAEKILDINTVTFDYTEEYFNGKDKDRKDRRGVIAEEVEEIMPEVVDRAISTVDNKEYISVDYTKFVPYLIKMVQIQNDRINALEKEIENLKK